MGRLNLEWKQDTKQINVLIGTVACNCCADGWQSWLHGSCAAAAAILHVIRLQSASSSRQTETVIPSQPYSNGSSHRAADSRTCKSSQIPAAVKSGFLPGAAAAAPSVLAVAVLLCAVAMAGKQQEQLLWSSIPQQLVVLQAMLASPVTAVLQLCGWAILAATSFCVTLQLLPGCFSLGEAALMAQGAACLVVTTARALHHAALFVPAAICLHLPPHAQAAVQHVGGCTAEAHRAALSLPGLPAVISLVLAAAIAACMLLKVLHGSLQQVGQHWCHMAGAHKLEQSQGKHRPAKQNGHHSSRGVGSSNGSSRVGSTAVLVDAAAALAAAGGICLVLTWLCCAAAWTVLEFLPAEAGRLGVLLYWVGLLAATLPALKWLARVGSMPQVRLL